MPDPRTGGIPDATDPGAARDPSRPRRARAWRDSVGDRLSALRPAREDDTDRDLVQRLEALPPGTGPNPEFRAELRAQLVAVSARLIAEGPVDADTRPDTATEAVAARPSRRRSRFARPVLALGAAAAVLIVLLGGADVLSRGSLPGDALYGLKRANENVQLSVTRGDDARGQKYLSFASRRSAEVSKLISRAQGSALGSGPLAGAGGISATTAKLVAETLRSADSDARSGSSLITRTAVTDQSRTPLTYLSTWSTRQASTLRGLQSRLPSGSVHNDLTASIAVIASIKTRVAQLSPFIGCGCLSSARTDRLGPVPCSPTACIPPPPPTTTSSPLPGNGPSTGSSPPRSHSTTGSRQTSAPPSSAPGGTAPGNGGGTGGGGGGGSGGNGNGTGGNGTGGNGTGRNGGKSTPTPTCVLVVCLPTKPSLPTLPTLPTVTLPKVTLPTIHVSGIGGYPPAANSPSG